MKSKPMPCRQEPTEPMSYNAMIKSRLCRWKTNYEEMHAANLNYTAIANKMEEDFHIRTSPQKISAMFDILSDREVKLQEIVALSQIFHFPLQDICEFPNAPASNALEINALLKKQKQDRSICPVGNDFYDGQYYCYYFKPKLSEDRLKPVEEGSIEEAAMNISISGGHSTITLHELKANTTFYGEPMPCFTLKGNLYHFESSNIAYSFISSSDGRRAMALMFSYLDLSSDIRYYMTMGMLTFSLNQVHAPLFQKMAVFRVKQDYRDPHVDNILRGILALNTSPIILDEDTIKQLIDQEPMLAKLIAPEKAIKKCYAFSENTIRGNSFFLLDDRQKIEILLLLKKSSLFPVQELVSESDTFTDFIKAYQREMLKKPTPDPTP